jgi:hypothetical protein
MYSRAFAGERIFWLCGRAFSGGRLGSSSNGWLGSECVQVEQS